MAATFSLQNASFIKFLSLLAKESGKVIGKYFRENLQIELKTDATPVTIADRKAEEIIRTLVGREFPDHGIIGEELGEFKPDADHVWIIDPIDGTKSFIAGVPLFGTLIALLEKGRPLISVIANPVLDTFLCGDNTETRLNGTRVVASGCTAVSKAILSTTSPRTAGQLHNPANFHRLSETVGLYRAWGDCFGYHLLSCGRIDIMTDPIMNRWDSLPLIPVVRGSGGIITTWNGGDPVADPTSIVAAAPGVHAAVIEILNRSNQAGQDPA